MEPKSWQLIASLPLLELIRWPPSIAYHNSLLGSGFALEPMLGWVVLVVSRLERGGCYNNGNYSKE